MRKKEPKQMKLTAHERKALNVAGPVDNFPLWAVRYLMALSEVDPDSVRILYQGGAGRPVFLHGHIPMIDGDGLQGYLHAFIGVSFDHFIPQKVGVLQAGIDERTCQRWREKGRLRSYTDADNKPWILYGEFRRLAESKGHKLTDLQDGQYEDGNS